MVLTVSCHVGRDAPAHWRGPGAADALARLASESDAANGQVVLEGLIGELPQCAARLGMLWAIKRDYSYALLDRQT